MVSITAAIGEFLSSIYHFVAGIFNMVFGAISGVFNLVLDLVKGIFSAAEGVVGFVLGNIFIIAVLGAAIVGYRIFVQNKSVGGVQNTSAGLKKTR